MRRLVDFIKSKGTRYVIVDTDGDPEPLIPLLMDAGVDGLWPIERAAEDMDPVALRKKYGRDLRLWGAVDKRCIAAGPAVIDEHLRTMIPLIEEGGFIPTVDHTVPPDISLENFTYSMKQKQKLLRGETF
jgi:uroporphyrinogen decarboxylase